MPSKQHEQLCRDRFDRWLADRLPDQTRTWHDGPEPPDFILTLSDQDHAVEVTSLVWQEPCGADDRPIQTVQSALEGFIKQVEKRAIEKGLLKGLYVIDFLTAIPQLGDARSALETKILEYIRCTCDEKSPPNEELRVGGSLVGWISKSAAQEDMLTSAGPDSRGGWGDDVKGQICSLLAERIQNKRQKLMNANSPPPWVLLLDDQYYLADDRHFLKCLEWIGDAGDFHTILVIRHNGTLLVLKDGFSREIDPNVTSSSKLGNASRV